MCDCVGTVAKKVVLRASLPVSHELLSPSPSGPRFTLGVSGSPTLVKIGV